MRQAKEYLHPGPKATLREIDHYRIISPIQDLRIQYNFELEDIRAELENVLGEEVKMGKVKGWFRFELKSGQLTTPPFYVVAAMNQVLINILTKKGFVFSEGSRIYHEIAWADKPTAAEAQLIQQNRMMRIQMAELEEELKRRKLANM